jgi:phytanoyl-CoA hydroxylase
MRADKRCLSALLSIAAMNTALNEQQVQQYRDQGFLAVEGFLDAKELETWRRVTGAAVEMRLRQRGWDHMNNQGTDDYYAKVFTQCLRLADISTEMAGLIYDPEIGRMAATLAGVDGIRLWHDQALIKPPFGNPTAWHLDVPYWSFFSRDAISIWVALDDATLMNGCMCYLPGTHRQARFDNAGIGPQLDALFKVYPEWLNIDVVAVPCRAGTAVFHNGLTAHGAGANMTNRPRRAMTCGFMPDGATFNGQKNILPDQLFARLKVGDPLDDPIQTPLIWKKSR